MPPADAITKWYLKAYSLLSAGRQSGMGISPLALSDIVLYWRHVGRIEPMPEFLAVIRAMDAEYLKMAAEQQKQRD